MNAEAVVSLSAAWMAHSPALLAFGGDSAIELLSAVVVYRRFSSKWQETSEHLAARITRGLLFALAAYVALIATFSECRNSGTRNISCLIYSANAAVAQWFWDYVAVYQPGKLWDKVPPEPANSGVPVVRAIDRTREVVKGIPQSSSTLPQDSTRTLGHANNVRGSICKARIELYIRTHCVARGLRPLTIAAYENTLKQFRDWIRIKHDDYDPDQLSARDVLAYVQHLRQVRDNGYSAINRAVVVLRRFYAAMVAMGQLDHNDNPLAIFPSIKAVPRKLPVALSSEQVTRLLSEPKPDTVIGLRDRALLALLYGTGIRASECAWLRNGSVDLNQLTITVRSRAPPYGYRYVKKTDTSAAYYEVVEAEAEMVRLIFDAYTRQGLSLGAIADLLNQREVPTRTRDSRWERPTLWRMLHNPAYAGHAFYGKTELRPRQRITRRLRQRGVCSRDSSFRERPRPEWIEIPVPALVSEGTFALAQEQFEKNKRFSPRRTLEPSLLQGLLVCQRCGYGLYRASTRTSQRTIYYYRCLGRDGYRHLKGAVCDNKPIHQEQLDAVVWQEIVRLLEDPSLLQAELDRRLQAAQTTDPLKRREDALHRDQARLTKSMDRLLTGYQENLITLEELRCRMPELRKQQRANEAELQSLEMTAIAPTRNLRLVETLAEFRARLRATGNVLEVKERQRVVRLLVHEILVGGDTITIRHSIPLPASPPDSNDRVRPSREPPEPNTGSCYLLRSHGQHTCDNVFEPVAFSYMGSGFSSPIGPFSDTLIINGPDLYAVSVGRMMQAYRSVHPHARVRQQGYNSGVR